jgi:GNAT superfamily N-acetyltransferase
VFSVPAVIGGNTFQYIYAAATHPDYRSRGLFGELLRFALDTAKDKGYAGSFLHPAEPSLTAYYARFGYRPWTYCQTECGEAAGELALEQLSSAADAEARALPPLCVEWPRPLLTYAAECGGAYKTKGAVLLCEKRGDTLLIKEQLGVADAAAVCNVLGAKRYERVCEKDSGDVYTLLLPFFEQELAPPYIGPVFD